MKYALHSILSMYKEKAYSKFGSNFNQALKTVAGSGHYRSEPLSLSGYNFDFEVLFGIDGKPLSVYPKYVTLPNALKSFGVGREGTIARDRAPPHSSRDSSKVSMLLEDLKSLEEVVDTDEMAPLELKSFGVGREDIRASPIPLLLEDLRSSDQVVNTEERTPLGSMDYVTKAACVRVASDWAERFASPSMMGTPRIARRVVFEVNGPVHYASNIRRHLRGNDVVKKRQLEALGWEVIHVSRIIVTLATLFSYYIRTNYVCCRYVQKPVHIHTYMWQSQVENEHYSTVSGLIRIRLVIIISIEITQDFL